jgi:hypothetical protein
MIDGLSALVIALGTLVSATFTGWALLRRERREQASADIRELRAYRSAWVWSMRTITKLRALLAIHDIPEPPGIDEQRAFHEDQLEGGTAVRDEKELEHD